MLRSRAKSQRADLDAVLLACGSAGDLLLDLMMKALREECFAERRARREWSHHRAILGLLQNEARSCVVLHATANVDGLTSMLGVEEFGATWRPRREQTIIGTIVADAKAVIECGTGFLHFPVHGEVGLLADTDPSQAGARLVLTLDEDDTVKRYSTVYQGVGKDRVVNVPETMAFAQFGYDLLVSLIRGNATRAEGDVTVPAMEPADFVVFGYGAGSADERQYYPLEKRLPQPSSDGAWKRPDGATWTACCFESEPERTVAWFEQRGFGIERFGRDGLSEAVRRAIARSRP